MEDPLKQAIAQRPPSLNILCYSYNKNYICNIITRLQFTGKHERDSKAHLVVAYAPTKTAKTEDNESFYRHLETATIDLPLCDTLFVLETWKQSSINALLNVQAQKEWRKNGRLHSKLQSVLRNVHHDETETPMVHKYWTRGFNQEETTA